MLSIRCTCATGIEGTGQRTIQLSSKPPNEITSAPFASGFHQMCMCSKYSWHRSRNNLTQFHSHWWYIIGAVCQRFPSAGRVHQQQRAPIKEQSYWSKDWLLFDGDIGQRLTISWACSGTERHLLCDILFQTSMKTTINSVSASTLVSSLPSSGHVQVKEGTW